MREEELLGARVAFDAEATRAATARMPRGAAEGCGCADCRDYVTRRATLLAQTPVAAELAELLGRLGCDPTREWELTPLRRGPGLQRELLVAWRFRGEFLRGPEPTDAALRLAEGPGEGTLLCELMLEFELPEAAE